MPRPQFGQYLGVRLASLTSNMPVTLRECRPGGPNRAGDEDHPLQDGAGVYYAVPIDQVTVVAKPIRMDATLCFGPVGVFAANA